MEVLLSKYGESFISRLQGKDLLCILLPEINEKENLILNFERVNNISISFATELIDSLNSKCESIHIINANQYINTILDFAIANVRPVKV